MEKNVIIKFLIALAIIYITNDTRCNGGLPKAVINHINYISRPEHWQDTWFQEVKTIGSYWEKKDKVSKTGPSFRPLDKLRTMPYMMGCAYGQKLNDFLRLTTYTIDECEKIRQKFVTDDCWLKLTNSVETCGSVMSNLLGVFRLLHAFNKKVVPSPIYELMVSIHISLEMPRLNWPIKSFAESLETLLNSDCYPAPSVVDKEVLVADYKNLNTIMSLYDFYVSKLNSYTGFISEHLHKLGFQYNANTEETAYTTPDLNEYDHLEEN